MALNGFALVYTLAGGLMAYSGIKGASLADTVKAVASGNLTLSDTEVIGSPTVDVSNPATSATGSESGTDSGSSSASATANQALAKSIATSEGLSSWTTGQNWSDWVSLWNQESGWSATAENPSSGAYGIAQALGHGTGGAPYPSSYKDANPPQYGGTSNPGEQIEWGISYIKSRYGSPAMAWAHEQANNWY